MTSSVVATPTGEHQSAAPRFLEIDAARGFGMLWVAGEPMVNAAIRDLPDSPTMRVVRHQLSHSPWNGLTYIDTAFPGFLILVGMSIVFSLGRHVQRGALDGKLLRRIVRRSALLFMLGVFHEGGWTHGWPDVRLAGILQRIAICYLVSSILFLKCRPSVQAAIALGTLLGHWALLAFCPVPGSHAGNLSFEGNLAAYLDRTFLPGRHLFSSAGWDPEGILGTLPAIGTTLLGVLFGQVWRDRASRRPVIDLFVLGVASTAIGLLWARWLPINKNLWTGSYVCVTAGSCFFHFAAFYLMTALRMRRTLLFFVVLGLNPLVVYMIVDLIRFDVIAARLGGGFAELFGAYHNLVLAVLQFYILWLVAHELYRRKIFVRT